MSTSTAKPLTDLPVVVMLGRRSPWPRLGRPMAFGLDHDARVPKGGAKAEVIAFPVAAVQDSSLLQPQDNCATSLCMRGAVRTKEKCRRCGGPFRPKYPDGPLECPGCQTQPEVCFVDFPWKGERLKLYGFIGWRTAYRTLEGMRAAVDQGTFDPREYVRAENKSLRFEPYARAWLERQASRQERGELSLGFLHCLRSHLDRHLIPHLGHRSIRDIHEGVLEDLREQLPSHLKGSSIRQVFTTLHLILKNAYARRDLGRIPAFPRVKCTDPVIRWLTREQQELVLAATASPVYRAFFLFLMKQGARPGEAMALRWECLDLKAGRVVIKASMDRGHFRPYTKTREERAMQLHPEVQEALKALPLRALPQAAKAYVFARRNGRPPTNQSAQAAWDRAVKAAGVPKCSLYQGTKHSIASQAVNAGVPLEFIAAALGHKDLRSTKRYAKVKGDAITKLWEPED